MRLLVFNRLCSELNCYNPDFASNSFTGTGIVAGTGAGTGTGAGAVTGTGAGTGTGTWHRVLRFHQFTVAL